MRVAPGVEDRLESVIATKAATDFFQTKKRVVFLDVTSKTEIMGSSKSRYNDGFI